eukprot:m.24319 g.24319  ORF g.24319 m.24319 type:complete len:189 (+) comp9668_c1_seq1:322-888(+)
MTHHRSFVCSFKDKCSVIDCDAAFISRRVDDSRISFLYNIINTGSMGCAPSLFADTSVAAWTLYGVSVCRCCSKSGFKRGAPRDTGCGTSCTSDHFDPGQYAEIIAKVEANLPDAAVEAYEQLDTCQHLMCPAFDTSTEVAARHLNQTWCAHQNKFLQPKGLKCFATNELHGFGRSVVRYLVIRVATA